MTDNTQSEALMQLADAYAEASFDQGLHKRTLDDAPESARSVLEAAVRRQHARIAELEAQLASIGAGGVTGPLIGQPQAMPDLSQLTERGAAAWAGVDAQGLREGFTAADMATASAQGFRDGVASPAASAGSEAVAAAARLALETLERTHQSLARQLDLIAARAPGNFLDKRPVVNTLNMHQKRTETAAAALRSALDTHPSPPEGMAGWQDIATAPKNGREVLGYTAEVGALVLYWDTMGSETDRWSDGMSTHSWAPTHWMPLPPAPTSAEGVEHE